MLLSTCRSRRLFALLLASPSGLMRSITAVTLFLFTVLGATASHATSYTWTPLDHPSATSTYLNGIDGANMVGYYTDSSGNNHGFMVTATSPVPPVPEPAAILLALFGLALLPRRRRR